MTLDNDDLNAIKEIIDASHSTLRYELKAEVEEMKVSISHLPDKQEFSTRMDEIAGELQTVRQEQTVLSFRVAEHSTQIADIQSNSKKPIQRKGT